MNWKTIDYINPRYEVSDTGLVRSTIRFIKLLNPRTSSHGYKRVGLRLSDKPFEVSVHRLVATAFIPNPENKPAINHKNGNKTDNRVDNLEWVTSAENSAHAVAHGLMLKGDRHPRTKLSESQVAELKLLINEGVQTLTHLAKQFGVSVTHVADIRRGIRDNQTVERGGMAFCSKAGFKKVSAPTMYSDDVVIKIQQLLADKRSRLEIQHMMGVSENFVQRIATGKRQVGENRTGRV